VVTEGLLAFWKPKRQGGSGQDRSSVESSAAVPSSSSGGGDWKQRWFVLGKESLAGYGSAKAASKASLVVDTHTIISVGLLQGHDAPTTAMVDHPGDDEHMDVSLYVQYRLGSSGTDVVADDAILLLRLRAESAHEAQQWVESLRSVVFKR
jgi:hypothetical protein